MKQKLKCKFKEEYVGDGDRAITKCNKKFPKAFITNRFSDFGYDIYKVKNIRHYQKFLFNDEFASTSSKEKVCLTSKNLKEAREKAKILLSKHKEC